ncbi:MAG: hypothetical protein WC852_01730 [Candidatus Nanoarchaeia archaeon]|jgi:hypothetical protein
MNWKLNWIKETIFDLFFICIIALTLFTLEIYKTPRAYFLMWFIGILIFSSIVRYLLEKKGYLQKEISFPTEELKVMTKRKKYEARCCGCGARYSMNSEKIPKGVECFCESRKFKIKKIN